MTQLHHTRRHFLRGLKSIPFLTGLALLGACQANDPQSSFFADLRDLCGGTYNGRVISDQAVDADWINASLTLGPVTCADDRIRMPLAVGEDTSRTWVITQTKDGLMFRHEHVEPDGTPSPVTQYGGLASGSGTPQSQAFPADEQTKANFSENGIARSNTNIWTLTLENEQLQYALARPATDTDPARDFRAVFDLR